jgi:hypothetical protein
MADGGSWESLQRHGLLSTNSLLELFEVPPERREAIVGGKREESVVIEHAIHGRAIIRDQKPLHQSKLEPCLVDCSFAQWLHLLNSRVFFWLTEERLKTLMCAREYCGKVHVVLTLDTLRVAADYSASITLAPMNTGNTQPFAHPRGLSTFSRMEDYSFEERIHRGLHYTVVELAVEGGIPNVLDYALGVREMRCSSCDKGQPQRLVTIRRLYP